jgi:hypothetical protein
MGETGMERILKFSVDLFEEKEIQDDYSGQIVPPFRRKVCHRFS